MSVNYTWYRTQSPLSTFLTRPKTAPQLPTGRMDADTRLSPPRLPTARPVDQLLFWEFPISPYLSDSSTKLENRVRYRKVRTLIRRETIRRGRTFELLWTYPFSYVQFVFVQRTTLEIGFLTRENLRIEIAFAKQLYRDDRVCLLTI